MPDKENPIVAIDFDGTIVEHDYPEVGDPVPHAIRVMKRLQEAGCRLILFTMRDDAFLKEHTIDNPKRAVLEEAENYCLQQGIEFWGINRNPDQHVWSNSRKVYAHIYIDDAALGAPLIYPVAARPYVDWIIVERALEDQGFLRMDGLKDSLLEHIKDTE